MARLSWLTDMYSRLVIQIHADEGLDPRISHPVGRAETFDLRIGLAHHLLSSPNAGPVGLAVHAVVVIRFSGPRPEEDATAAQARPRSDLNAEPSLS
jgi:hypothetical protein